MKRLKDMTPEVDTHTHTMISGHSWSTLRENVLAAKERGLKGICLTEHGPALDCGAPVFTPHSQRMLPAIIDGIRVYKGIEANIMGADGSLDIPRKYLSLVEFGIASYHDIGIEGLVPGDSTENTGAYLTALNDPDIDILGHADDPRVPCELEALVIEAGRLGKLLELNNNRIASGIYDGSRLREYALLCKKHSQRICVGSDAHYYTMVGNVAPMMELLDSVDFPPELIVNLTFERFEAYMAERKHRREG